jgi:hypothetical protein
MRPKRARGPDADLIAAIRERKRIAIRAGSRPHRFIPLWAVVVERRVFVRSWSLKPGSWHRVLVEDPVGTVLVGDRKVRFRAVQTRSERLRSAVDHAYLTKYGGPTEIAYARDLGRARSRASTTQLVLSRPVRSGSRSTA